MYAILTKQAWSITDISYGQKDNFFLWDHCGKFTAGKMGSSCGLGQPIKTQDSHHLICSWIVVILNFFCCPQQEWAEWGVTQLQLSTVDFNNAPSQEMIQRGVAFIEEMNENEKTVYVHCKAGRGRSTTLVACYLMKVCSFTANCISGFRLSKSRLTLEQKGTNRSKSSLCH